MSLIKVDGQSLKSEANENWNFHGFVNQISTGQLLYVHKSMSFMLLDSTQIDNKRYSDSEQLQL